MVKQECETQHPDLENENKIPTNELGGYADGLRDLFLNRIKKSIPHTELNGDKPLGNSGEYLSIPLEGPRWGIRFSPDDLEIEQTWGISWVSDGLREPILDSYDSNIVKITTGNLPSIKHEHVSLHDGGGGKKPVRTLLENTRSAVIECSRVINAIPQAEKAQKVSRTK